MQTSKQEVAVLNLVLLLLVVFFLVFACANLSSWRLVSGDEVWTIFTADKLAREGIFGNDLFTGFYNAEDHYFFGLPLQPVMHAIAFSVSEPGIVQARWVSVGATFVTLITITWLAHRWFGLRAALCTALLFVLWRNNLTNQDSGMPLLGTGRSARWDITPLPWMWLAVFAFDSLRRKPGLVAAILTGVFAALAAQTHYFGGFIVIGLALAWFWPGEERFQLHPGWAGAATLAFVATLSPLLVFVAMHYDDALAQFTAIHGGRTQVFDSGAILPRLGQEVFRYSSVLDRVGLGNWVLIVGVVPVLILTTRAAFRNGDSNARLVIFCLFGLVLGLALVDVTKAPVYAISLLPAICLLFGKVFADLLPRSIPTIRDGRTFGSAVAGLLLVAVLVEGVAAYAVDWRRGNNATPYDRLGAEIGASIVPNAVVTGPPRWAWAMRDQHYLSLTNLQLQWIDSQRRGRPQSVAGIFESYSIDNVILTGNTRIDMDLRWPTRLKVEFFQFLQRCAQRTSAWDDAWYGPVELFVVRDAKGQCAATTNIANRL